MSDGAASSESAHVVEDSARRGLAASQFGRSTAGNAAASKELDDLKTKLRVIEKKRAEDREKLKAMETLRAERDKFETIIQKLQTKYQPQQQEIAQLRKQIKEAETKLEEAERLQAEHDSVLEMAALDREMAEEMADSAKLEYEALKTKYEELELEVEVLREENQELGQVMSPEEKSSQGWLQLERTNERLRDALIRLRDITQQQEADLRNQIKEMEEDLEDYRGLRTKYESTKEKLATTEANMEELKQQVEALGAEEMIEELTEKNMQYQEEVNELKAVIEDLESLKELNDELDINHVETEKQLLEEIDYRDSLYQEQSRKLAQQDEVIQDLEYTLSKFRELVSNLQNHLEDMRVSQQISETEATDLTSRSRAMIDLNMKLQASVAKAQVKTIDLELGRMEADESAHHLSIMKLYMPDYFDTERNPILALLRFKRVGFKASLIANTVRERMSDSTNASSGSDPFIAYDVLEKLTWTSLLCDRFVRFISGCQSEEFPNFEGALYELDPVERILNAWVEDLKKDELNEKKCADELQRSIAVLSHLAETLIPAEAADAFADETYMRSVLTQTYMEHAGSGLTQLKIVLQAALPSAKEDVEEWPHFTQKLDTFADQARGGKVVVGKVTRSLEELRSRSLCLTKACAAPFEKTERAAKDLSELVRLLGQGIVVITSDEGRAEPITYSEILASMSQTAVSLFQPSGTTSDANDALALVGNKLRTLAGYLEDIAAASSDLSQTVEFERQPAPWISRAKELKAKQVVPPDADEEIRRLKNELFEASTSLGVKDKVFEEQSIKIELLESRMRDATKKAALVKELETTLETVQGRERELLNVVERQSRDLQQMQAERDEYRGRLEQVKRASGSTVGLAGADGIIPANAAASLAIMRENESLRAEVTSLQAAIRFVKDENRRMRLLDPYSVQRANNLRSWLDVPLVQPKPSIHEQPERRDALECQDVLTHLLKLSKESQCVDLKATRPADGAKRLTWRPSKSTSRYLILKQREEYEHWNQWKDDVARRERARGRRERAKSHQHQSSPIIDPPRRPTPSSTGGQNRPIPTKMARALQMLGARKDDASLGNEPYESAGRVRIVDQ
jgi:dynactin 1